MNILITGAAGYIGSILVKKLVDAKLIGHYIHWSQKQNPATYHFSYGEIDALDNLMYKQMSLTDYCYKKDFRFIYGDVRNEQLMKSLVEKADIIIPLAAIVGFPACERDKSLAEAVNYEQILTILKYCRKDTKIIYPNTNSGYGIGEKNKMCTEESPLNPISHYGVTKCKAEKALLDSGQAIVLRLATVFGVSPRMRLDLLVNDFVYKAVKDGYIILFEKEFNRNFIHVQDVALTFIHAITNFDSMRGNIYNVGLSDTNLTKLQLAERIQKFIPDFYIGLSDIRTDPDKRDYIVSNTKLEKTKWFAKYSLNDGIEELIKAYKILGPINQPYTNL